MSHKNMNSNELASLLGLDYHTVIRMARKGLIPSQTIRGELRFHDQTIFSWLNQMIPNMSHAQLIQMDQGLSQYRGHGIISPLVSPLLNTNAINLNMDARTQTSIQRKMVGLAEKTQCVYDSDHLFEILSTRPFSHNCALLTPDQAMPYTLAESVIAFGRTQGSIQYAHNTHAYFFVLCAAKETVEHLHLMVRICRILSDQANLVSLHDIHSQTELIDLLCDSEDALCSINLMEIA